MVPWTLPPPKLQPPPPAPTSNPQGTQAPHSWEWCCTCWEGSWDGNPDDLESCGARGGDKTSPVTPNFGRIIMDVMVYEKNPEISLCDSVCAFFAEFCETEYPDFII